MSRWRLTARDDRGRAVVTVLDNERPVGVVNISVRDYEELCKKMMSELASLVNISVYESMNDSLWQMAQRAAHEDAELAKTRLMEIGWSQDAIKKFATEVTIKIAGELLKMMPGFVS